MIKYQVKHEDFFTHFVELPQDTIVGYVEPIVLVETLRRATEDLRPWWLRIYHFLIAKEVKRPTADELLLNPDGWRITYLEPVTEA